MRELPRAWRRGLRRRSRRPRCPSCRRVLKDRLSRDREVAADGGEGVPGRWARAREARIAGSLAWPCPCCRARDGDTSDSGSPSAPRSRSRGDSCARAEPTNGGGVHGVDSSLHSVSWEAASVCVGHGAHRGVPLSPREPREGRGVDAEPGARGDSVPLCARAGHCAAERGRLHAREAAGAHSGGARRPR